MNSNHTEVNVSWLIFLLLEGSSFHTTTCNILFLAFPFLTYAPVKIKTKQRTTQYYNFELVCTCIIT